MFHRFHAVTGFASGTQIFNVLQSGYELGHQAHAHLIDYTSVTALELFAALVGLGNTAGESVRPKMRLQAGQAFHGSGFCSVVEPALLSPKGITHAAGCGKEAIPPVLYHDLSAE